MCFNCFWTKTKWSVWNRGIRYTNQPQHYQYVPLVLSFKSYQLLVNRHFCIVITKMFLYYNHPAAAAFFIFVLAWWKCNIPLKLCLSVPSQNRLKVDVWASSSVMWIQEIRGKTTFKNKREEREVSAGFVLADTVQSENSIFLPRCRSVTTIVVWTKATFSALPHEMVIGRISTRIIEKMIAKEQEYDCGRR